MNNAIGKIISRTLDELLTENKTLEAENAELRKVLAWYGDAGNYETAPEYLSGRSAPVSDPSPIEKDDGQRAREAQRQGGK